MGSVTPYETEAGRRWRVRYRTPEHRQTDKRGFRTKRDAELYLANVEVSKAAGSYVDPQAARITVGELAVDWLANKRQAMKPSSFHSIDTSWRVYVEPRWSTTAVGAIRPSAVEQWIRELGEGVRDRQPARAMDHGRIATAISDCRPTSTRRPRRHPRCRSQGWARRQERGPWRRWSAA